MRHPFLLSSALLLSGFTLSSFAAVPTFYEQVLPVLQSRCQGCHRPGEAAPMSFLDYKSTRPWAKAIRQAVISGKMPPWFADPRVGHFSNALILSDGEKKALVQWAEGGAPEGDPARGPKPLVFTEGWDIGKPDVVYDMGAEFSVPPQGTLEYTYLVVPTGFTEDKWVQFAEARPGNREVVHHMIVFVREKGSKWLADAKPGAPFLPEGKRNSVGAGADGGPDEWVAGYAPGQPPVRLLPGQARKIKAGSDFIFQLHYTSNGKAQKDRSRLGLTFAKGPVQERVLMLSAGSDQFAIPPGAANYRVQAETTLASEVKLFSMQPHMHLRGKSFSYRAYYPDGRHEDLLSVPGYDFRWQNTYLLPPDKILPAGTRIECIAFYDNSANNPLNPNPNVEVKWGDQSWDEMMVGFFEVAVKPDARPQDLIKVPEDRKKKKSD